MPVTLFKSLAKILGNPSKVPRSKVFELLSLVAEPLEVINFNFSSKKSPRMSSLDTFTILVVRIKEKAGKDPVFLMSKAVILELPLRLMVKCLVANFRVL